MDNVINTSFFVTRPVEKTTPQAKLGAASASTPQESFRQVLERQIQQSQPVQFSAHAKERMASRQMTLGTEEVGKITDAVDRAADKGSRNTLVIGDQYALIVNVPNRTVITAMNRAGMNENVVTNIDSTVFVE
jgi:flagellar operon protein